MDFRLSNEQAQLRDSVRNFAQSELPPLAKIIEETCEPPPKSLLKQYAALGYLGINLPEPHGGHGATHLEAVICLEEVAKISPAAAFPIFESNFGPVLAIAHFGSDELRNRLIPAVCAGDVTIAISMSEPNAGTALTDLSTRATLQGDEIVIKGQKRWCSGAGHAEGYLVYCRMTEDPGSRGIGAVYVDAGTAGLSFGKPEELMGFRGVPSADMYFDEVRVPKNQLVVGPGGFKRLMEAFDLERCGNATMSLALAQAALDYVVKYVQERHQFGKPIVEFQAVQLKLAEMAMKTEASRLLIYQAVCNAELGLPSIKESSMAKCFANEITREVTGAAIQLMGGYGYNKEYPVERFFRDAWGWGIAGGAIDIQKVNIAAAMVGKRFDQRG
jgi:alkylation response protein AidB-like acyl-CoA dehydrogenase